MALLAAVAAGGCSTNLSTLQTARTLDQGQWRVSAGGGVYVPAGQLGRALDQAAAQAERLARAESGDDALPTPEEQRAMFNTAAALVMYPPGPVTEVSARYGVAPDVDAGLRWSTTSWRLDGRWRFLRTDSDTHLALVAGVEKHTFSGLFFDLYEAAQSLTDLFGYIELEDPSRWDVEAQLIASKDMGQVFQPYAAFKYRAALYSLPAVLTVEQPDGEPLVQAEDIDGVAHFLAGTGGVALGYRSLWFYLELNIASVRSEARILGEPTDLGGLTVYPAFGVAARF